MTRTVAKISRSIPGAHFISLIKYISLLQTAKRFGMSVCLPHPVCHRMRSALPLDDADGPVKPASLDQESGGCCVVDIDRQQTDQKRAIRFRQTIADRLEQQARFRISLLGLL